MIILWYFIISSRLQTDLSISGDLDVSVAFQPPSMLLITVHGANNLAQRGGGHAPDPFVKIAIPGQDKICQTRVGMFIQRVILCFATTVLGELLASSCLYLIYLCLLNRIFDFKCFQGKHCDNVIKVSLLNQEQQQQQKQQPQQHQKQQHNNNKSNNYGIQANTCL